MALKPRKIEITIEVFTDWEEEEIRDQAESLGLDMLAPGECFPSIDVMDWGND